MIEFKFEDDDTPYFYSVDDVARITQLAPRTIYRAIADGQLQACRLRRQLRVPRRAVDEWSTASLVAAPTPPVPQDRRHAPGPPVSARRVRGRLRPLLESR